MEDSDQSPKQPIVRYFAPPVAVPPPQPPSPYIFPSYTEVIKEGELKTRLLRAFKLRYVQLRDDLRLYVWKSRGECQRLERPFKIYDIASCAFRL